MHKSKIKCLPIMRMGYPLLLEEPCLEESEAVSEHSAHTRRDGHLDTRPARRTLLHTPRPLPPMIDERTPLLGPQVSESKARRLRLQAAATLGASVLGTGILAQPRACSSTGLVAFVALSVAAGVLSHLTSTMLARTAGYLASTSSQAPSSFSDVVAAVLGHKAELFTMWVVTFMQIGCCVGYMVVIGDVFTPLIRHWTHHSTQPTNSEVVVVISLVLLLPMCVLVRKLTSLRFSAASALLVIMFFGTVVVVNGIYVLAATDSDEIRHELIGQDENGIDHELTGPFFWPEGAATLKAIPLICFAYFMHFNVIPVFRTLHELQGGAIEAYEDASRWCFTAVCCMTVAFGIFGYLTFLSETDSDILSNFWVSGTYISSFLNVVRAFYGLGLVLAFPVVLWEARENLKRIIYGGDALKSYPSAANFAAVEEFSILDDSTTGYDDEQLVNENGGLSNTGLRDSFRVHAIISATLVVMIAIVGSLVSDLEVVFGLIGSTCTPVISYILPASVYLKSGAAAAGNDTLSARVALVTGYFLVPFGMTIWILSQMGKLGSD